MATERRENTHTLCANSKCNHPRSFHKSGKSGCHVVACECTRWAKPKVSARKVAKAS